MEPDRTRRYVLEPIEIVGDMVIDEHVQGDPESSHRLWNLGPEGSVEFDGSDLPVLRVRVHSTRIGDLPWEREFLLFLRP